jgi:hypothetical protein
MRLVKGVMKLLRACFSSFQCIFYLAKHNDWYFSSNFNPALRYVPSMLWNISEISEIFWKVLWAGQTSGISGHGYFRSGCAICGWNGVLFGGHCFTVLSIVSIKLCTMNLIRPWHYIYAANCTNKKLILDLSSSFFWYSWLPNKLLHPDQHLLVPKNQLWLPDHSASPPNAPLLNARLSNIQIRPLTRSR